MVQLKAISMHKQWLSASQIFLCKINFRYLTFNLHIVDPLTAIHMISSYVTGYWKTDHNVTLGQLHFIGPANSHTHALSMHRCIIGLS